MSALNEKHDVPAETVKKIEEEILDLIDMDAYTDFQKGARRGLIWAYGVIKKHTGGGDANHRA